MHANIPPITRGIRLRTAREWRGLKQAELAKKAGVARNTVSNYEKDHGERVSHLHVAAIASALDVPVEWLEHGVVPPSGDGSAQIHRRFGHAGGFGRSAPFLPGCPPMWKHDLAA